MLHVYSKTVCSHCRDNEDWLKRNNIPFIEHNIDTDKEAFDKVVADGFMATPVLYPNNELTHARSNGGADWRLWLMNAKKDGLI